MSAELARARIFFFFCSPSSSTSNSYSGHFRCRNLIFQWVTKKKFSNFDGILPEFAGNFVKILGKFGNFAEIRLVRACCRGLWWRFSLDWNGVISTARWRTRLALWLWHFFFPDSVSLVMS